jgi:hypothetical protein
MTTTPFATSATPHITVNDCHADLAIIGSPENQVVIEIDDESPATHIERTGETIVVTAMDSCEIVCPASASITVQHVSGDLRVNELKGTLAIDTVNGDVSLRDIGPTMLRNIQGDLSVRDGSGDLRIETVRGDAKVKRVAGNVAIDRVSGDLVTSDLGQNASFGSVNGDISIDTDLKPGQAVMAKANGDIVLRINSGGAQLNLNSRGDLRCRVPVTNWQGNDRSATARLGDGSAAVSLTADGDLLVLPGSNRWDTDSFSGQVESMIESAMGQFESQMTRIQSDLEKRLGGLRGMGDRTERAAERARHAAERAKQRAERAAKSWGTFFTPGRPSAPPTPPAEPVTDQERLAVLKMVEEGKITADDAAKLLAAMEG